MFLEFYRLREQPFGVTPDPRFLYFSPAHREALASLFYGIETGRGFLALIAQPGMGKTSLLMQLLERVKDSVRTGFLFQTQCDSHELLRYVMESFGLSIQGNDTVQIHSQLYLFLFREALADKRVVLVIDEAQNLSDSALETVRLLSDFEAHDKKLLQIVLAGQLELAERLARPGLSQLRQRIAVLKGLDALPAPETTRYIEHRLKIAGYDGPGLFTPAALGLIAERSQGIPRNINNICFNALSLGCAMKCNRIGPDIIVEATADLSLDAFIKQSKALLSPAADPIIPAIPATIPAPVSSPRAATWLKGKPLQVAAFAAVFGSLLGYFGGHVRAGAARSSVATVQLSRSTAATPIPAQTTTKEPTTTQVVVDQPSGAQAEERANLEKSETAPASFVYVVQRNDTLREICLWTLGRYDTIVLAEIQRLNQGMINPNRLTVGQQVRLPLNMPVAGVPAGTGVETRNPR